MPAPNLQRYTVGQRTSCLSSAVFRPALLVVRQSTSCQQTCLLAPQQVRPSTALMCHALVNDSQSSGVDQTKSAPSTSGRTNSGQDSLLTFAEVQQIAAARGLHVSLRTLGPAYRIVCRDGKTSRVCGHKRDLRTEHD